MKVFFTMILSFLGTLVYSQTRPSYSLFLMGDAGEPTIINSPQINSMRTQMLQMQTQSSVIFLGDNIYPKGICNASRTAPENRRLPIAA